MDFLKLIWKGQLKNVQDGIFRPLGSREIQKTKVGTVLPDTCISSTKTAMQRMRGTLILYLIKAGEYSYLFHLFATKNPRY